MKVWRAAALLLVLCCCGVKAADWPQWRGPERNGCSPETGLLPEWPAGGPARLWVAEGLGTGYASVAVVTGRVYTTGMIGDEGHLFAWGADGKLLWKRAYGPEWKGSHPGARSTPTIYDGRAYVMSGNGRLVCADAGTGEIQWQVDTLEKFKGQNISWGLAESPLIVGDKVICTPGAPDASLVAFDRKTGRLLWTTEGLSERAAACSPLLLEHGRRLLIVTSLLRSTVGVDAATGKVLWTYDSTDRRHIEDAVNPNTPVQHNCELLVPAIKERGAAKLRLDANGGEVTEVWAQKKAISHLGGMVLAHGRLHVGLETRWACVDWATGKVLHEAPLVGKGTGLHADGRLYCYGERGEVALVNETAEGYKVAGRLTVDKGSGEHFAHLALADGRLYVRHGDALLVYQVKERP